MVQSQSGYCAQDNCRVSEDGKCLEGLLVKECPHFVPESKADDTSVTKADADEKIETLKSEKKKISEYVHQLEGDSLTLESSDIVTRSSLSRVIILAGPEDCGKTTLLACLNDRFQHGYLGGYCFAGSLTLPGFEKRCHNSRIASGRTTPETDRTKFDDQIYFLHLSIRKKDHLSNKQDLLFSDISGEHFRLMKDSTDECKKLSFLPRADHFLLLIDGEKLTSAAERHVAVAFGISLLRSCLDAQMLGTRSFVDIVTTKWDIIKTSPHRNQTLTFLKNFKTDLAKSYESRLARLRFFDIAARPTIDSGLEPGFGLDKVFPSWVEDSPLYVKKKDSIVKKKLYQREFDNFRWKV